MVASHPMSAMPWVRTFLSELHAWEWLGILVARSAVGFLFFLPGRGKLFVPERREQMRQTLIEAHVPFPEFNALFVSTVEFVFGLLLIFGAITPLACAMLSGVMIVALQLPRFEISKRHLHSAGSRNSYIFPRCSYL